MNIDVDDLERAVAFYQAAFALRPGRRFANEAVEMLGGSSPIYLLGKPAGTQATTAVQSPRRYERHWTPVHLDFVVDDIETAVRRAQHAGATLEIGIGTYDWGRFAGLADPFGNGFCLIQFLGRGYDEIAS